MGECQQVGELLLVVACALLVRDTLLRQEGNEPIRCALLALDNVLEGIGGQGGHRRRVEIVRLGRGVIRVGIVLVGIGAHCEERDPRNDEGTEISESLTLLYKATAAPKRFIYHYCP